FLSMSVMEAFCTLRILPRMGSRAWNSESRALLAVPRALSPSTMNSSERSMSVERQSASLVGMVEDSRACLRRETSLCMRAAVSLLGRAWWGAGSRVVDDLVDATGRRLLLRPLRGGEEAGELLRDHLRDDRADRRGAQHLRGLALVLWLVDAHADHGGQPGKGVVLLDLLFLGVELDPPSMVLDLLAQGLDQRLLETCQMGAALGGGDD